MNAPTALNETDGRDLLAEWLAMGREVLERYFPETDYAVLVAEQRDGKPAVQFVVIPSSSFASTVP